MEVLIKEQIFLFIIYLKETPMAGISKVIILACIIALSLSLSIAPWLEDRTIPECTEYFTVTTDYQHAVCVKPSGTYAYKWNSNTDSYVPGELITTNTVRDIQLTSEGKFLAIRITDGADIKLNIYYRDSGDDAFTLKFSKVVSDNNYHLTNNHQHLVYSTGSQVIHATVNATNEFNIQHQISRTNCDASIVDGGTIIYTANQFGIYVYPLSGGVFNLLGLFGSYKFVSKTMSTSMDSSFSYLSGSLLNNNMNLIIKFDFTAFRYRAYTLGFQEHGPSTNIVKADQTAISSDNKWFAYASSSISGYSLAKLNDDGTLTVDTQWQNHNTKHISFRQRCTF